LFKEKYKSGKEIRKQVPRATHAQWKPSPKRLSAEQMIILSDEDRLPNLIPVRHFRMSASPFVFYRATASLMAADLATLPSTGMTVQACGDCHLMNFGGYATPERHVLMDINDFDETLPAPWEWDLKRLATSFQLAGREKGFSETKNEELVIDLVSDYQQAILEYSNLNFLDLWYLKFDLEEIVRNSQDEKLKGRLQKTLAKGNKQTQDSVFYKMTSDNMGKFSITEQPPLILHPFNLEESIQQINNFMSEYKNTLQPDRRFLVDQYKVVDVALKVVGVGSVGTRCYVAMLLKDNEPLFLQVKEARRSVMEAYTNKSAYAHQGERVVQGQRMIQSASDIFLGWSTGPTGKHFYLRQLRDKKISPNVETMDIKILRIYANYCSRVLAKAHCKTARGAEICGYMGKGDEFARSIASFAKLYADQTEKDFNEFTKAVKANRLTAKKEVPVEA
jgi:uncharacterized protein (DUF2252 family)